MFFEQHCQRTLDLINDSNSFVEVHKFLDQYAWKYGFSHRLIFHHEEVFNIIPKKWHPAARLHILDDYGFIPKAWREPPLLLKLELYTDFIGDILKHYPKTLEIAEYIERL